MNCYCSSFRYFYCMLLTGLGWQKYNKAKYRCQRNFHAIFFLSFVANGYAVDLKECEEICRGRQGHKYSSRPVQQPLLLILHIGISYRVSRLLTYHILKKIRSRICVTRFSWDAITYTSSNNIYYLSATTIEVRACCAVWCQILKRFTNNPVSCGKTTNWKCVQCGCCFLYLDCPITC